MDTFEATAVDLEVVTRGRILMSVPNVETIPYLSLWLATPFHMLAGDHKDFFTRPILRRLLEETGFRRIEIQTYGEMPLRSQEGFPLHYHLLAVCET